jgi:hypothetical protein
VSGGGVPTGVCGAVATNKRRESSEVVVVALTRSMACIWRRTFSGDPPRDVRRRCSASRAAAVPSGTCPSLGVPRVISMRRAAIVPPGVGGTVATCLSDGPAGVPVSDFDFSMAASCCSTLRAAAAAAVTARVVGGESSMIVSSSDVVVILNTGGGSDGFAVVEPRVRCPCVLGGC